MSEIKGSCRCGKVTCSSSAEPAFVEVCHCKKCQKSTGIADATVIAVPTASLAVTGPTTQFDDVGDSGEATHRNFCADCGSTITLSVDVFKGMTMITVGTLDNPGWAQPDMQIYCDSAMPWAKFDGLRSFAKMPG